MGDKLKLEGDEQIGVNIVKRALQEPLRQGIIRQVLVIKTRRMPAKKAQSFSAR